MAEWKRTEIGGEVSFGWSGRHETVDVSRAYDGDGIDVDISDSTPYQGCGHRLVITDKMLEALGYTKDPSR